MTSKFASDPEVSAMLKDLSQRIASKPGQQPPPQNGTARPAAKQGKTVAAVETSPAAPQPAPAEQPYEREIVWFNAIGFLILHLLTLYGIYLGMFHAYFITDVWG